MDRKSFGHGIQSREFDAVVGRQTKQVDLRSTLLSKVIGQTCRAAVAVVVEAAVAVDLGIASFVEDVIDPRGFEA